MDGPLGRAQDGLEVVGRRAARRARARRGHAAGEGVVLEAPDVARPAHLDAQPRVAMQPQRQAPEAPAGALGGDRLAVALGAAGRAAHDDRRAGRHVLDDEPGDLAVARVLGRAGVGQLEARGERRDHVRVLDRRRGLGRREARVQRVRGAGGQRADLEADAAGGLGVEAQRQRLAHGVGVAAGEQAALVVVGAQLDVGARLAGGRRARAAVERQRQLDRARAVGDQVVPIGVAGQLDGGVQRRVGRQRAGGLDDPVVGLVRAGPGGLGGRGADQARGQAQSGDEGRAQQRNPCPSSGRGSRATLGGRSLGARRRHSVGTRT